MSDCFMYPLGPVINHEEGGNKMGGGPSEVLPLQKEGGGVEKV